MPSADRSAGFPSGRPGSGSTTETRRRLLELLEPVVTAAGYDLEDVTVTPAGRRSLVRVSVDADGGIDLDAVAAVTRAVSDALDDDTPGGAAFAGPYVLEVSSPGVDRPLTEPRHWRRAMGRLVEVEVEGAPVTGRVVDVSADDVTLDLSGNRRHVPLAALGRGRVQVEFTRGSDGAGDPEDEEG
jgi:ribosome maturation factor RimP